GVDVIFFGGTSSNGGGIMKKQMGAAGLSSGKFIGGDGIVDDEFFTEATASGAEGAYGAVAAHDPPHLPTAAKLLTAYTAAFGSAPGAYSANPYAAMNILLQP